MRQSRESRINNSLSKERTLNYIVNMANIRQKLDKELRKYGSDKLPCRTCGQNISVTSHLCPHCGDIDPFLFIEFAEKCEKTGKIMGWFVIIAIVVIIGLFNINWIIGVISLFVIGLGSYALLKWHQYNKTEEFAASALDSNFKIGSSYDSIKNSTENKDQWKRMLFSIAEKLYER